MNKASLLSRMMHAMNKTVTHAAETASATTSSTPATRNSSARNISTSSNAQPTPIIVHSTSFIAGTSSVSGRSLSLRQRVVAANITSKQPEQKSKQGPASRLTGHISDSKTNAAYTHSNIEMSPETTIECKRGLKSVKGILDNTNGTSSSVANKVTARALEAVQSSLGVDTPRDGVFESPSGDVTVEVQCYEVVSISRHASSGKDFTVQKSENGEFEIGHRSSETGCLEGRGLLDGKKGIYTNGVFTQEVPDSRSSRSSISSISSSTASIPSTSSTSASSSSIRFSNPGNGESEA